MSFYLSTDLYYSSMTSDDYDNVTSSTAATTTVNKKNRAKKPKLATTVQSRNTFDDDDDDTCGISSNFTRKIVKKKQNPDDLILSNMIDNELLYEAMLITKADYMIEFACKHCCNRKNMEVMEWSEAVLLQLCDIKSENYFSHNMWKLIKTFVLDNQWALPISYNLQKYTSAFKSLAQILDENHQFKQKTYNLNPTIMFLKIPTVRYSILKKYKINSHKMSISNKLPDLKLKIK